MSTSYDADVAAWVARAYKSEELLAKAMAERDRLRGLLREWSEYTGLRQRIRESDDPTEYETGRDLLARTDAALGPESREENDG